ncbi:MAG: D-alanine--D-alanine ligase [Acidimicrobiia bacterium]|nr:D-alanine--D-alanine ligase [Acidimicrobiia bacterium]
MTGRERIRLVVLFGGQSAEHDVSRVSALHVLAAADRDRYDVVPVGITRDGRWVAADGAVAALEAGAQALPSPDDASTSAEVSPLPAVLPVAGTAERVVVLPLLHGPMGEDGTVQGLCELAGVPYVGAGVAASAVCMDKGLAKAVVAAAGIPQCRWLGAREQEAGDVFEARVESELGWPVFVKPANMGSSIGVTKAADRGELRSALAEAFRYDEYVVVEEGVTAREIEVAVLGNAEPRASVPGEIVPGSEFYDYADKYETGAADLHIPADLDARQAAEVQALAVAAYRALRVDGMARVDFFYEQGGRGWLLNELNTIPGFTPISMYPKLWEASGLPYAELVDELVRLALERHDRRARFSRQHEA